MESRNERTGMRAASHAEKKAAILRLVREGVSSRLELGRRTGYRSTTVSRIASELVGSGILREVKAQTPVRGRGRPPSRLEFAPACLGAITLHLSGRTFHAILSDADANVVAAHSCPSPRGAKNDELHRVLEELVEAVVGLMPVNMALAGLVCAFPGIIDTQNRIWLAAARWPEMNALSLEAIGRSRVGEVMLVRNLDAEHQSRIGEWPERSSVLLHWGYGISLSHAGRLGLSHSRNPFGEVGHWEVGTRPGSGQVLEEVASLAALLPDLRQKWPGLPSDEEAFADVAAGLDIAGLPEMQRAIDAIVTCMVNVGRIFFPDIILLSGPFGGNDAVMAAIVDRFPRQLMRGVPAPRIVPVAGSLERERLGIVRPLVEEALQRACASGGPGG